MTSELVKLEVADHVATVTLSRSPVNALNSEMREALIVIFDEINDRDDIRVAVLTAQGRVFCAGADLRNRPTIDKPGDF